MPRKEASKCIIKIFVNLSMEIQFKSGYDKVYDQILFNNFLLFKECAQGRMSRKVQGDITRIKPLIAIS